MQQDDNYSANKIVEEQNKRDALREKTAQEVAYEILGIPLVRCSEHIVYYSLNTSRLLKYDDSTRKTAIQKNATDFYNSRDIIKQPSNLSISLHEWVATRDNKGLVLSTRRVPVDMAASITAYCFKLPDFKSADSNAKRTTAVHQSIKNLHLHAYEVIKRFAFLNTLLDDEKKAWYLQLETEDNIKNREFKLFPTLEQLQDI